MANCDPRALSARQILELDLSVARRFSLLNSLLTPTIRCNEPMANNLTELTEHDFSDDCPICRAQDVVQFALLPAAAAWESNSELPRFSIALHGAAELLGT